MKRFSRIWWGGVLSALFLFYPDQARGQPTLLLDGNLTPGYQGLDGLVNVQAGQRIDLEVYGKNIEGASGFSAQIAFDASQLAFDGFTAGDVIPDFTGLKLTTGGGMLEIGGASVRGASRVMQGRLGVLHLRVLDGFSGNVSVSLGSGQVSIGGTAASVSGQSQVTVGLAVTGPVLVDADAAVGLQAARRILDVEAGDLLMLEVYGTDLAGASGFTARLTFDANQLAFDGFTSSELIPDLTGLDIMASGEVEIGGASVRGVASASAGRLGLVRFRVLSGFTGETTIKLLGGRLSLGAATSDYTSTLVISILGESGGTGANTPDFNGNGTVDFPDFLMFASGFGKRQGDAGFDAKLDLDGSGVIDFPDFLSFAQQFGKQVGG